MKLTGGQAVVAALEAHGVDVVFGIPGIHTLHLYDALYQQSRIHHVTTRHEQGAGFMADGYARASGKVGVLLTTTGPGAVNALTPLGEAHADSSPVLLIASGPIDSTVDADLGTLHEMRDQFATLHSVCGQGCRVSTVEEIPAAIAAALTRLQRYRPRPYVLEIPLDLFAAEADFEIPEPTLPPPSAPYPEDMEQAVALIRSSALPLIVAGGGAQNAAPEIVRLAEHLHAPVALTSSGLGTFPADHPLFLGAAESVGEWVEKSDLVLAAGTRFSERIVRSWKTPPAHLIHLDIDQRVTGRTYRTDGPLIGDTQLGLQNLLSLLEPDQQCSDWPTERIAAEREKQQTSEETPFPQILHTLRRSLDRDAVVANDMTMICYQARRLFPVYAPRTFLAPNYYGTLGFSFPAAIGAKLAHPDRQVVSLCGDGGFLFTAQELSTARQQRLSLPILLFNDHGFTAIRRFQDREFEGHRIAVDVENPDFQLLARSFGIGAARVTSCAALSEELEKALQADLPTLIEVPLAEFSP
jgi:thiamine pyrophosphate-dependent acetolactate synthase large subunit-like protein